MRRHIEAKLDTVAGEHGFRVLHAAESDRRAWRFGSPDSDYDVRFIHAHPRDWYIQLSGQRDALLAAVSMPPHARSALDRLMLAQREIPEFGRGPNDTDIDAWVSAELQRLQPERLGLADTSRGDVLDHANAVFRRIIGV